ncbi:MAG: hypothetical protein WCW14_01485 [Candidatus Paceibacterota bacterium]|jgi:hypothetical protein
MEIKQRKLSEFDNRGVIWGFVLLTKREQRKHFRVLADCQQHVRYQKTHPFGITTSTNTPEHTYFVGVEMGANDKNVEAFLANIQPWVDTADERQLHKLRIIKIPCLEQKAYNYVLFEMWIGQNSFISGEAIDITGTDGMRAINKLMAVFILFMKIYDIDIEEITLDPDPDIKDKIANLYKW